MRDDQTYLGQLIELFKAKSKEWDQRSKKRQAVRLAAPPAL